MTPDRSKAANRRPQGQPTRGKTAPNRLRRVDTFLTLYDPGLLRREDGAFAGSLLVDLGYGFEPVTTLESAARLRRLNPELRVLGVEIDPERVAAAQPFADGQTFFRLGGFNLPLLAGERARCIRAFNVLRQYPEDAVEEAYRWLAAGLLPGGLLVEGTSEPFGRLWVANVVRRREGGGQRTAIRGQRSEDGGEGLAGAELAREALVFGVNLRHGFDPSALQAVLPKNLIHRVTPGEPIFDLFGEWKRAAQETSSVQVWGARAWFRAAAGRLAQRGYAVTLRRRWLDQGLLVVRNGW